MSAAPAPLGGLTMEDVLADPVLSERFANWVTVSLRVGPTPWRRYVSRKDFERRFDGSSEAAESVWLMVEVSREPFTALPWVDDAGLHFRWARSTHHELMREMELAQTHKGDWWTPKCAEEPVGLNYLTETMRREEARASCALDGYLVGRADAREMFAAGRLPQNVAELAVRKTYTALCDVQSLRLWSPPSLEWLLGLHERFTAGTTNRSDAPGRLRRAGEQPLSDGSAPLDIPLPPAESLPEQLSGVLAMFERKPLDYSSNEKALLALFAISYLRPFVEGNGRVARALYYAFLSERKPTTPAQLVALSSLLLRLRDPFGHWMREVIADRNDVGYFTYPALFLVRGAMRRVQRSLFAMEEMDEAVRRLFPSEGLNERQVQALSSVVRTPDRRLTVEIHRQNHATVYETARTDLAKLADLGLLRQEKLGRTFIFSPAADLCARLGIS